MCHFAQNIKTISVEKIQAVESVEVYRSFFYKHNYCNWITVELKITDFRRYKENIKAISKLVLDQPMKPMDKAIWWIEYVIRNKGTPHFKTLAVNMSWFTYLLLDVILFLVLSLVLFIFLSYSLIRLIVAIKNHSFKTSKVKQY